MKLEYLGFRGSIHTWIVSFHCRRKQFVSIGGEAAILKLHNQIYFSIQYSKFELTI